MDDAGNYNNVLVVEPSLTPDPAEEKRVHVRPLAKEDLGDIRDTAWDVSAEAVGQKATAAETENTLEPQVSLEALLSV